MSGEEFGNALAVVIVFGMLAFLIGYIVVNEVRGWK